MASLLANVSSSSAGTSPVSFADIPDFSATVSVASTSSIIVLMATVQQSNDGGGDQTTEFQWAVGGTREGPVGITWNDAVDEDNGLSGFTYALTGLSGSQTFSLQWQQIAGVAVSLDTAVERRFQILEVTNA